MQASTLKGKPWINCPQVSKIIALGDKGIQAIPMFGMIGCAASVLGAVLTVYFAHQSAKKA